MELNKKYILFFFMVFLPFRFLFSQPADRITNDLVKAGFENIRTKKTGDGWFVTIENQVFRWDVTAVTAAMNIISEQTEKPARVRLILLEKDIPKLLIEFEPASWQRFTRGELTADSMTTHLSVSERTDECWEMIRHEKPYRRNYGKTDLVLHPQLSFENTLKERLYTGQFNIAPALRVTLIRGMQLTGQCIFPLYNELGYEGDFIRPGQIVLSQEFKYHRLTGRWAAGNFSNYRYGGDLTFRYLLPDENWSLKLNAGLTGNSHFLDHKWEHGIPDALTWSLSAAWFIPHFEIEMEGGMRQYIYGDTGIFGACTRWFGETAFGFYAQYSHVSVNGGFHFTFPFPDKKRSRIHFFRLTIPDHQDMIYNSGTEFYYGQTYRTGPEINMVRGFYRAEYMKKELLRN